MPVRMDQDDFQGSNDNFPEGGGRRGSSGGGGNIISFLLPFAFRLLRKNPKLGILLLVVCGAIYMFKGCGGSSVPVAPKREAHSSSYSTGFQPNKKKYNETLVFAALADNIKNPLPESVSLLKYCPTRLNQGSQGSCVGWASSYAARTILHARATGENPNQVAFSPSYLYNQIALTGCQGAYLKNAMETMHEEGVLPFSKFKYDENSCSDTPEKHEELIAESFKISGYNRLSKDHDKYEVDMLAIKQNLAQGAPVIIGMMVGGTFMQAMEGRSVWIPSRSDYNQRGFGGHAMCVIGYDDFKEGGAFQIMNSWGENWGNKGIAYVRYKDFAYFTKEAYGLHPMGNASKKQTTQLKAKIGLVLNTTAKYVPLQQVSKEVFTTEILKIGTKFKMEITNNIACYIYIFGQEKDGSSYVLFPYTKKHSPYCGITGTRLFPKDFSMRLDDIGNKDCIAVVVTSKAIDYNKLNQKISLAKGDSYGQKVESVIQNVTGTTISTGDVLTIQTDLAKSDFTACVVEINKK